jgi:TldD protein
MTTTSALHKQYFFEKFGISEQLMERCLGEALSAGGEYADLYFESVASTSLGIDESLVKSASQGVSAGCGAERRADRVRLHR